MEHLRRILMYTKKISKKTFVVARKILPGFGSNNWIPLVGSQAWSLKTRNGFYRLDLEFPRVVLIPIPVSEIPPILHKMKKPVSATFTTQAKSITNNMVLCCIR